MTMKTLRERRTQDQILRLRALNNDQARRIEQQAALIKQQQEDARALRKALKRAGAGAEFTPPPCDECERQRRIAVQHKFEKEVFQRNNADLRRKIGQLRQLAIGGG